MTLTTKAALADELGITRARVSQYVKAGLPVRSDGKLNREDALNWIKRFRVGQVGSNKGADRAARLAKPDTRRTAPGPDPVRELTLAQRLVGNAGGAAARAALKVGCSMEQAYAIDLLVGCALDDLAAEALIGLGHDEGLRLIGPIERAGRDHETDFDELASESGLPFDEEACERFSDNVIFPPDWQPPPGSPAALADGSRAREATHG